MPSDELPDEDFEPWCIFCGSLPGPEASEIITFVNETEDAVSLQRVCDGCREKIEKG